ncbi:hypothetical protein LKM2_2821 [Leptospira kirschneri serovar Mozdok]|nr:hypothetical protein [Leptospira kirschneri serovar Mozdok]
MIVCINFCASAKSSLACFPVVSLSKIAGYLPLSSQAVKKGVQSINGTNVSKDTSSSKTLIPTKEGLSMTVVDQSIGSRFSLACSREINLRSALVLK